MDYSLQSVNLDRLVECALLCNVLNNPEVELRRRDIRMSFSDLLDFLLRANSCDDGMASLEEDIEDVGCNEAATTYVAIRLHVSRGSEGQ